MSNEYLDQIPKDEMESLTKRGELVAKFAWAIPTPEAIDLLVRFSPIVEIGAGTGYWANLVNNSGGKIVPFDKFLPRAGVNPYRHKVEYIEINLGGPEVLKGFSEEFNLFLCWPPYDDSLAMDSLKAFRGKHLIYIGEYDGCNATEKFFEELSKNWEEKSTIRIPQFTGLHDEMYLFQRHGTGGMTR